MIGVAGHVEPSDAELLFRVSRGDEGAYRDLIHRHEASCYRVALAMTRTTWDAEEAVGSAFAELWRRRDRVRLVDESVRPWLLTVVSFAAKNQLRGLGRYRRLLAKVPREDAVPDHADEVARLLDGAVIGREVRDALARLRAVDAALVVLCLVEGLTMREAALATGVPEGTVKSRLSRAKARLRQDLAHVAPAVQEVTE
ncbi:RNA polymerase sigma factor (sigma-70 family) [Microbacterium sp. SORGH_AS 888]|nr:RNA polymerase sigma factor (sigma-70 family) [Microbacterium sp. SORGH_AS_0888]